jgi:hypothetical protein
VAQGFDAAAEAARAAVPPPAGKRAGPIAQSGDHIGPLAMFFDIAGSTRIVHINADIADRIAFTAA